MIWLLACTEEPVDQPTLVFDLVNASDQVTFASAEALGPHRLRSVRTQTEYHGEEIRTENVEVLLIDWADWDHWQSTQLVNGDVVSQVWVMGGRCIERVGEQFVQRLDGEPYRVQLRNTWNQWDSSIRYFQQGVKWEFSATEEINGRKTKHFKPSFNKNMIPTGAMIPMNFSGNAWVFQPGRPTMTKRGASPRCQSCSKAARAWS